MQFIVRYWVGKAPVPFDGYKWDDSAWLDHSVHPATRLGLHNAVLSAEDRLAVLREEYLNPSHGCDIFLVEGESIVILSVSEAESLLAMIEQGDMDWENFRSLLEARHHFKTSEPSEPEAQTHADKSPGLLKTDHHSGFNNYLTEEEMVDVHQFDLDA